MKNIMLIVLLLCWVSIGYAGEIRVINDTEQNLTMKENYNSEITYSGSEATIVVQPWSLLNNYTEIDLGVDVSGGVGQMAYTLSINGASNLYYFYLAELNGMGGFRNYSFLQSFNASHHTDVWFLQTTNSYIWDNKYVVHVYDDCTYAANSSGWYNASCPNNLSYIIIEPIN